MTGKDFLRAVSNGRRDIIDLLLRILHDTDSDYCVIGGLAVNAFAEPVVSLDLDLVVVADKVETLCRAAADAGLTVERFQHSVNLSANDSDLRIQVQIDPLYQDFIARAETRTMLGYALRVAAIEDVLAGKLRAYADPARRKSKRQKDLADIARLVEARPSLAGALPDDVRKLVL